MSNGNDIGTRVRDAIAMNVDLMDGSPQIVERAIVSAGDARRRRRRHRVLATAFVLTAGAGTLVGLAVGSERDGSGLIVSTGSSTSTGSVPSATEPLTPAALVAGWDPSCGTAPKLGPIAGLRFTLQIASTVVAPGESDAAALVFENTTVNSIRVGTGVGEWYVTTVDGRLVGTSRGYPVLSIGFMFDVPAHRWTIPKYPEGEIAALVGACTKSGGLGADFTAPLPRGQYLAWFGIPSDGDTTFVSAPAPFEVGGAPLWNVPVSRAQATATGRADAYDPNTTRIRAKLASWQEIQEAGAYLGTSPTDVPERRIWVVSIMGNVHEGMCCIVQQSPFTWGAVFIDAATGKPFAYNAGRSGHAAPWFAGLLDHGA